MFTQTKSRRYHIVVISLITALIAVLSTAIFIFVSLLTLWFTTDAGKMIPAQGSPTALDGSGKASISPDMVKVGQTVESYTITYIVGQYGMNTNAVIGLFYPSQLIVHGDQLKIYVPYLASDSIKQFIGAKIKVSTNAKAEIKVIKPSLKRRIRLLFGYYRSVLKYNRAPYSLRDLAKELIRVNLKVTEGRLNAGDEIKIEISRRNGMKAPANSSWVNFSMEIDGDGDGVAAPLGSSPRVVVIGDRAAGFRVTATSAANIWEVMRVSVEAIDDAGNVDPTFEGTVYLDAPELSLPGQTEFTYGDLGRKVFQFRTSQQGVYFLAARDEKGRKGRSNPIVVRETGPHLYWGDLHIESVFGIGDNTPEFAFRAARDDLNMDFAGVVMTDSDVPLESHDKLNSGQADFAWGYLQNIAHTFSNDANFAAFPVIDWASNEQGHRLIIFSPDEVNTNIISHSYPAFGSVEKLLGGLPSSRALIIPIWTAWRGGKFMGNKYEWGPVNQRPERLIEVYSSDGASEYRDNPFPIHGKFNDSYLFSPSDQASGASGAFARDALSAGHRFGIIAGGARRFSLDKKDFYEPGMVAVWAQSLSEREIWGALNNRRVYATTGPRIYIDFRVNNAGPGEEITTSTAVAIELIIVGTAPISEASVIKYTARYETARTLSSNSEMCSSRWVDVSPPLGGFYFLRVVQADGNMAWAGPIWVR